MVEDGAKIPVASHLITLKDTQGVPVTAPTEVWLGVLLSTLPPDWRQEVVDQVLAYTAQPLERPKLVAL